MDVKTTLRTAFLIVGLAVAYVMMFALEAAKR
jgi:hypothetical protein